MEREHDQPRLTEPAKSAPEESDETKNRFEADPSSLNAIKQPAETAEENIPTTKSVPAQAIPTSNNPAHGSSTISDNTEGTAVLEQNQGTEASHDKSSSDGTHPEHASKNAADVRESAPKNTNAIATDSNLTEKNDSLEEVRAEAAQADPAGSPLPHGNNAGAAANTENAEESARVVTSPTTAKARVADTPRISGTTTTPAPQTLSKTSPETSSRATSTVTTETTSAPAAQTTADATAAATTHTPADADPPTTSTTAQSPASPAAQTAADVTAAAKTQTPADADQPTTSTTTQSTATPAAQTAADVTAAATTQTPADADTTSTSVTTQSPATPAAQTAADVTAAATTQTPADADPPTTSATTQSPATPAAQTAADVTAAATTQTPAATGAPTKAAAAEPSATPAEQKPRETPAAPTAQTQGQEQSADAGASLPQSSATQAKETGAGNTARPPARTATDEAPTSAAATAGTDARASRRTHTADAATDEPRRTRRITTRTRAPQQSAAAGEKTPPPIRTRRTAQKQQAATAQANSGVPTQAQPPGAATPKIVEDDKKEVEVKATEEKPRPAVQMTSAHADAAIRYTGMLLQQGLFKEANAVLEASKALFDGNEKLAGLLAISRYATNQHNGVLELSNARALEQPSELSGFWPLIEHLANTANGDVSKVVDSAERYIAATSVQRTTVHTPPDVIDGEAEQLPPPAHNESK